MNDTFLSSKNFLWFLFGILIVANLIDATTTEYIITKFGIEMEANPLMRWGIETFGMVFLHIFKGMLLGAIAFLISIIKPPVSVIITSSMMLVTAVYVIVVTTSLAVILS